MHSFRLVSSDSLTEDTARRAPQPTTPAFSKWPQLKYQPESAARKSMQRFVHLIPQLRRHAKKACDDFFSLPSTTSKCILRRKLLHATSYFSVYANFNSTSGDNKRRREAGYNPQQSNGSALDENCKFTMETRLPHRILHMHNPGTAAFIIFMRVPSRGRPGESVHHNYHSVAHAPLSCYVQLPNYNEEKLQCIGVLRLSGSGVGEGEREEAQTTGLAANPSRQASERAFFAYYRPDTVCHILRNVHQINVAAAALPSPLLR